jgi:hypothetical protein
VFHELDPVLLFCQYIGLGFLSRAWLRWFGEGPVTMLYRFRFRVCHKGRPGGCCDWFLDLDGSSRETEAPAELECRKCPSDSRCPAASFTWVAGSAPWAGDKFAETRIFSRMPATPEAPKPDPFYSPPAPGSFGKGW